jgi:pimeloyl-ACP methyl ester carboxylesterase
LHGVDLPVDGGASAGCCVPGSDFAIRERRVVRMPAGDPAMPRDAGATRPGIVPAARGATRLAFDAIEQLSHLVEAMHANISAGSPPVGRGTDGRTRGITGFVYGAIRTVNAGARAVVDRALRLLPESEPAPEPGSEALLAALNGVLGDRLAATGNRLALPMRLRPAGEAKRRVLVLVHGLCMNDGQWTWRGHDHGAALARDLDVTPVYARYNTGRHVSENGRDLAERLEALLAHWPEPEPELTLLAHSMGGLVARSACHVASEMGHAWRARLTRLVCLGTPHHGVPLERGGNQLQALLGQSPYFEPLARLGMLRSAGITDLRYGNVRDEDWHGHDRFAHHGDRRVPTPLPADVECHAIAADRDPLVPVESALGLHRNPEKTLGFLEAHRWVARGLGHFDLLGDREVYARLRAILTPRGPRPRRRTPAAS